MPSAVGTYQVVDPVRHLDGKVVCDEPQHLLDGLVVDAWGTLQSKRREQISAESVAVWIEDPQAPAVNLPHEPVVKGIGEVDDPQPVVALATVGLILPVIAVLLFSPLATLIFLVWRASRAIDAEDAVVVDAPLPMLKFEGKVKCETRFCIT